MEEGLPFQTLNLKLALNKNYIQILFTSIVLSFMTGVWVAFEDVLFQNGPVRYILKSHEIPIFNCDQIGMNMAQEEILIFIIMSMRLLLKSL